MIILAGTDYICFLYEDNNILTAADKKIKNINHTGIVFAVVLTVLTVLTVVLIVGLGLIVVLTVLAVVLTVLAVVLTIVLAVLLAVVNVDSCVGRWTLS